MQRFKDYCLKYGSFLYPSSNMNFQSKDIQNIFKNQETWNQLIFYCKPFCKQVKEKRGSYNEGISKPSFMIQENNKDIYLNGEIKEVRKVAAMNGGNPKTIKKAQICLKALEVSISNY